MISYLLIRVFVQILGGVIKTCQWHGMTVERFLTQFHMTGYCIFKAFWCS